MLILLITLGILLVLSTVIFAAPLALIARWALHLELSQALAVAAVVSIVGDLSGIVRIVKVVGFVASAPDFTGQPHVVNGASELLGEVFGDAGLHARSAIGVAELPMDAPVEVEVGVEVS